MNTIDKALIHLTTQIAIFCDRIGLGPGDDMIIGWLYSMYNSSCKIAKKDPIEEAKRLDKIVNG